MNYILTYKSLIIAAKKRNTLAGYFENHHILPKCMGGSNNRQNLVKLTGREHFIAHWLLVKIHPDNSKLKFAFKAMCMTKSKSTAGRYKSRNFQYAKVHIKRSPRVPLVGPERDLIFSFIKEMLDKPEDQLDRIIMTKYADGFTLGQIGVSIKLAKKYLKGPMKELQRRLLKYKNNIE